MADGGPAFKPAVRPEDKIAHRHYTFTHNLTLLMASDNQVKIGYVTASEKTSPSSSSFK
jgi:hypothetical protein